MAEADKMAHEGSKLDPGQAPPSDGEDWGRGARSALDHREHLQSELL